MKFTDDPKAKLAIWAANPQIEPAWVPPRLPRFTHRKWKSYDEYNAWKEEAKRTIARICAEQAVANENDTTNNHAPDIEETE